MATLLYGPRLGAPSSSGFKVWVRASGAATVTLETRLVGASDWTLQDTQSIDTSKYDTAVLTASGLEDATTYEYRVLFDGVQVATNSTMTMPVSGRFVLYHLSDTHGTSATSFARALTDWETTYEPLGIPAFIFLGGDLLNVTHTTVASAVAAISAEIDEAGESVERLPLVYMFDDWDWAGNNSSRVVLNAFTAEADRYASAIEVQDVFWRDHPAPTPPSRTFLLEIAGVPLLVLDQRSQRTHPATAASAATLLQGSEPLSNSISAVGVAHRAWIRDTIAAYSDRDLILVSTGTTWVDSSSIISGVAARDGIGLCFRAERNYLIERWPIAKSTHMLILSGDDHRSAVYRRTLGEPKYTAYTQPASDPTGREGKSIGRLCREFKVASGGAATVAGTTETSGLGDLYQGVSLDQQIIRWDITSAAGGRSVSARITFVDSGDGSVKTSSSGASAGRPGDFSYRSGVLTYYDGSTQVYPVENSPAAKPNFGLAYLDEVAGTLHTEDDVFRSYGDDYWGPIIRSMENYERDDDRDKLQRIYEVSDEAALPLP